MQKGLKETSKWSVANRKAEKILTLLRKALSAAAHEVGDENRTIDGIKVMLEVRPEKDVHGYPNGRVRILYGEQGERQHVSLKDDATDLAKVVTSLKTFIDQKRKRQENEAKSKVEFDTACRCARELVDKYGGKAEGNQAILAPGLEVQFSNTQATLVFKGISPQRRVLLMKLIEEVMGKTDVKEGE